MRVDGDPKDAAEAYRVRLERAGYFAPPAEGNTTFFARGEEYFISVAAGEALGRDLFVLVTNIAF